MDSIAIHQSSMGQRPFAASTACTKCGTEVFARNPIAARYMGEGRGIVCDECRNGRRWTVAAYADYRASAHWRVTEARALVDGRHKCRVCAGTTALSVVHNDYSRLGGELPTDLVVLCQECQDKLALALPY